MRTYLIALASAVTLLGCRGITLDSDQASTGPSFVPRFADAQPLPRSMCDGLADAWAAEEAAKKVLCTNCWDSGGTFYTVFEGETLTSMYCDCGPWKKFASSDAGTLELGWIGVQMMFGGTPQMYSCREDACTEAFLTTPSQCDQQLSSEEARGACQACFQEGFTAFDCAATLTNKTKRCANPEVPATCSQKSGGSASRSESRSLSVAVWKPAQPVWNASPHPLSADGGPTAWEPGRPSSGAARPTVP